MQTYRIKVYLLLFLLCSLIGIASCSSKFATEASSTDQAAPSPDGNQNDGSDDQSKEPTPSPISGNTYYIRTDGNDTCNGLSSELGSSGSCALKTIQKGAQLAQAGDRVLVFSGTYAGFTTSRSGASGKVIQFVRNGTDTVTISGQIVINHSFIELNGFNSTYSDWYEGGASIRVGYSSPVSFVTVKNCSLKGGSANTVVAVFYGDDIVFDHNVMEGPTFFIGIVSNGKRHNITNNIFRNVRDVERLFNVAASDSVWRGNEIYDFTYSGTSAVHPDIWQTIPDGSLAQNNVLENNYIHDTSEVQLGCAETNSTGTNVSNWLFRNNVFANTGTFYIAGRDFKFHNNTFYRAGFSNQAAVFVYKDFTGDGSGADFRNNIFLQDKNVGTFGPAAGSPTISSDYNFVANTDFSARSGSEAHGIRGGDPQFLSTSLNCMTTVCDFHLRSTSIVIDKGVNLSAVPMDFDGVTRPRGATHDIGAGEF